MTAIPWTEFIGRMLGLIVGAYLAFKAIDWIERKREKRSMRKNP